jgi:hypothetical protein
MTAFLRPRPSSRQHSKYNRLTIYCGAANPPDRVPARLKEWAYAGFAINLASALIARLSVGDGPEAWIPAAATGVPWGLSHFLWRRLAGHASERLTAHRRQFRLPLAEGAGYAERC